MDSYRSQSHRGLIRKKDEWRSGRYEILVLVGLGYCKKRNVAVVTIMNYPPRSIREKGPFNERFMRLKFMNKMEDLKEERVIATLYGCIMRRLLQKDVSWNNAKFIPINYNEESAEIILFAKGQKGK